MYRPRIRFLIKFIPMIAVWCTAARLAAQTGVHVPEWPVELEGERGTIIIYQPQIESFSANVLQARAAVAVTAKGQASPVFGAVWLEARMSTDTDTRLVSLESVEVTSAKFPDQDPEKVQRLADYLEREIPTWNITLSLNDLLTGMEGREAGRDAGLKHDPPEIIFVARPSVLVTIDGDPKLADLENADLDYVVNTPFFIVQEPKSKNYYMRGEATWYVSREIMANWAPTADLPKAVVDVNEQIRKEEEQRSLDQQDDAPPAADSKEAADSPPPDIIVRTKPAEIVETDGEPKFAPLEGTNLLYVENTESDILMDISTQEYFVLLSGRWYKSTSMSGNEWEFVPNDRVPADFAKIPTDSDMAQVLPSVAGTQEAKEALLENSIPQTAEIDRKTASVTVAYDGDPKFEKCGSDVAYAVNTDKSVLLVDGTYYCCDEAIWFVSDGPQGPWQVATEVPKQIQDIPPDCPAYNVKYVYIYDSTPDVVYVGYTPAYYGSYVFAGCVVYGTGWWYRPWYYHYYYPRPVTYGFGVHYNSVTGWGFSFGVSYGWLHISVGRPWYGGWWGPCGYRYGYRHGYARGYYHGYHHGARAGYAAGYRAGQRTAHNNMYRDRAGVKHTGARPTTRPTTAVTKPGGTRPGTAQAKTPRASQRPNNVYADKNGNVYRREGETWQKNNKGRWSSSKQPTGVSRDAQARQRSNHNVQRNRSAVQNRGRPPARGGRRR